MLGKKTGRSIEGRSKTLADKDIPIGRRIEFRKASVKKAKEIMTVQNNKIKNAKDQKVEQAKKNLQSPVKK